MENHSLGLQAAVGNGLVQEQQGAEQYLKEQSDNSHHHLSNLLNQAFGF